MKIGIITIIDNNNFGNRLQNYAMQEILKLYCNDVTTIKNISTLNSKEKYLLRILKYLKINTFDYIFKTNKRKLKKFKTFNKNICITKKLYTVVNEPKKNDFTYFVVGSDQVWNPTGARLRNIDLLTFANDNQKISYAASTGVSEFDITSSEKVRNNINNFKAVSVREDAGKEIIEKITGRKNIEVLIDPTMLLTDKEWDKVSKKPTQFKDKNEKYILNYFLGNLNERRKNEIKKIAKENNCKIINILDKNDMFYISGPSEFLWLEKHAFLICTDSFHSCVFAILYNRPFVVFNREDKTVSMNSRIETLLSKFKLKNRKFNGKNITRENLEHDYTEAYKILESERKKSDAFLSKALDIEEEK